MFKMVDTSAYLQNIGMAELERLRMLQERAKVAYDTTAAQNVSVLRLVAQMNKNNVSSFKVICHCFFTTLIVISTHC